MDDKLRNKGPVDLAREVPPGIQKRANSFSNVDQLKPQKLDLEIIEKIATQTRTGMIPGMAKPNQDSSLVLKDFGQI